MSFAVVRRFGFSLSVMLFLSSGLMAQRSYDGNSNAPQAPATVNITQGPTIQYADDQFAVITWTTDQPLVRPLHGAAAGPQVLGQPWVRRQAGAGSQRPVEDRTADRRVDLLLQPHRRARIDPDEQLGRRVREVVF